MIDLNKNRHSVYKLQFHLVLVTKYRKKVFTQDIMKRLKEISYDLFDKWNLQINELNGEDNHIHILFESNPQTQLSKFISNYKTVSSRLLRKEFSSELNRVYYKPFLWEPSYFISSTGGTTLDIIKKYIENQNEPTK